jgi:HEAT repeat protein
MTKSKSPKVKAVAIQMMTKYSHEAIKPVGYLLVKQINDLEPKEVLEAASVVLSKIGEEERVLAISRLKSLLNSQIANAAAEILIQKLHRADLVAGYVTDHLKETGEGRGRAIAMICLLPEPDRVAANPYISDITAAIQQGRSSDPAMEALACMGPSGLQAVRQEVSQPSRLPRHLAAQALAEMDLKNDAETLKTVQDCLKDQDEDVRKWCSQSMGKVGKLALPHILDLLRSNDPSQHREGQQALGTLNDPDVAEELRQVRAENSGWTANRKKFGIAHDVSNALSRIESKKE